MTHQASRAHRERYAGQIRFEQSPPGRCPSTGKISYRTRRRALRALDRLRAKAAKGHPNRPEQGVYECRSCGNWHLTHYTTAKAAA